MTVLFGILGVIDSIFGAILPLQKGTVLFLQALQLFDVAIYYVRALLPLTISAVFAFLFQLFAILVVVWIMRKIIGVIPFLNRFGSNAMNSGIDTGGIFGFRKHRNSSGMGFARRPKDFK